MERPALRVVVRVEPPADLSREQINTLMDGEVHAFERDLQRRQREQGLSPDPLNGSERGIIKAYILFAHGRTP